MTPPAGCFSIQDAAKILSSMGISTGPTILFGQLRQAGVLMADNMPYQRYMSWFRVKKGSYERGESREVYCRTFITETGLQAVKSMLQPPQKVIRRVQFYDASLDRMQPVILGF
jgi:phage antirepressor YoqD-like protein